MKILKIFKETISDGPGWRYSIYVSGCKHACIGCHNLVSWAFNKGRELDRDYKDEIINDVNSNGMLTGITLCGGDPMFSAEELLPFIKELKTKTKKHLLMYTGFTIEEIVAQRNENSETQARYQILKEIDTLIDGRWIKELYDPELQYRGSSNQRIIELSDWFKQNPVD